LDSHVEKSKFHDGAAPKSTTRTYSVGIAARDMKVTGLAADGTAISQAATLAGKSTLAAAA
jgi:hypothetical protein